ncbi:hypothetical protein YC2023_090694 [Brassica napus]
MTAQVMQSESGSIDAVRHESSYGRIRKHQNLVVATRSLGVGNVIDILVVKQTGQLLKLMSSALIHGGFLMTLLLTKYHMVACLSREIFTGLIHIQQMTSYSFSMLQKRELNACVFPSFNIPAVMFYQLLEKKNSHCYI